MTDIFIEQKLIFDSFPIDVIKIPIPFIDECKFGILNLKAISTPYTKDNLEIIFMIDNSGSMSEFCSDNRTKMQHIIHTIKHMILYFKENSSINVWITVDTFCDKIQQIVERTSITNDNYELIIQNVQKIAPDGCTNIKHALKSIQTSADKIMDEHPEHTIINMFMTDGEDTCGNSSNNLIQYLNPNITNIFIGFGNEHDSYLLTSLSDSIVNGKYYFIDKIENSGLVYGEILHSIVYKLLKDVSIFVENGLIYNYKTNTWNSSLLIGDVISESDKTYHIISTIPEQCVVSISNNVVNITKELVDKNLTNFMYRQRTLQYLYMVSNKHKHKYMYNGINIKELLRTFIDEITKYMTDNEMMDDKFLKNLCDDIYISYKTFNTKFGGMYNTARQTSQGTQRCYTVNDTENLFSIPKIPILRRNNNYLSDNEDEENDDLFNYSVSDFADTPYLTQTATQIMREFSNYSPSNQTDINY